MINLGTMCSNYEEAKMILKKFDIAYDENFDKVYKKFASSSYSDEFKKCSRKGTALKIYQTAIDYKDYSLYLPEDGAFFQFTYSENSLRFAYFERPHAVLTYREFLEENAFDYDEVGEELYDEFNQYLLEAPQKEHITNIRYDYSEEEYRELVHPVSHLHIGQNNNIRLPLSVILLPASFIMLVIKQVYWEKFKQYTNKNDELITFYLDQINNVKNIKKGFFSTNDATDLAIRRSERL
ncbi:TPA: DUF2290 domain-containing protein [Streptococcus suis]|nr:DUF2290 domain-containing protein [Streptococcus suis]NQJ77031.1 DUF2290 domain-containing protein [Streptococcus suis]NQO21411.1 DUF2290 domain-containing protein [Streptococcus suis]NQP14792.1 DUF2290 domain-containing protein [Streptococcus suis]NRG68754.1 DUF2290 domain-containing protein [Streptococcus suis]